MCALDEQIIVLRLHGNSVTMAVLQCEISGESFSEVARKKDWLPNVGALQCPRCPTGDCCSFQVVLSLHSCSIKITFANKGGSSGYQGLTFRLRDVVIDHQR